MFCDQVVVTLKAGDGGSGCVSFRREKYVSHGGPDGGNGGKGGDVIFKVNPNLNSLIDFRSMPHYSADPGRAGQRFDKAGRGGENFVLDVPPGTQVYDAESNELIVDLVEEGSEYVILHGGKGGFGNAHFATSVRQAPDFAEKGEPGMERSLRLEMRLVADVGIIGLPSVGKSTLIARISNAKPKIADYPFTTLVPNMGVVDLSKWGGEHGKSFVVADIPGLIEGAHEGKGLGDEFLRHVSRTAILLHVLDCQSQDMFKDFVVILGELEKYDPQLAVRPQILVVNKIDTVDDETQALLKEELLALLNKKNYDMELFFISAVSGDGLKPLVYRLWEIVQILHRSKPAASASASSEDYRVFRPHLEQDDHAFQIEEFSSNPPNRRFVVHGKRIDQIVVMSDVNNRAAVQRIYHVLDKMGILKELRRRGAILGDQIQIGEASFDFRG